MCAKNVCPYKHPVLWVRQKWNKVKFWWNGNPKWKPRF